MTPETLREGAHDELDFGRPENYAPAARAILRAFREAHPRISSPALPNREVWQVSEALRDGQPPSLILRAIDAAMSSPWWRGDLPAREYVKGAPPPPRTLLRVVLERPDDIIERAARDAREKKRTRTADTGTRALLDEQARIEREVANDKEAGAEGLAMLRKAVKG